MNTIIFGVDGSDAARSATAWAGQLARQLGAAVVAVHAAGLLEHQRGDAQHRGGAPLRADVVITTASLLRHGSWHAMTLLDGFVPLAGTERFDSMVDFRGMLPGPSGLS